MASDARNKYIRHHALEILRTSESSVRTISEIANRVEHGRKRPTAPTVIRRELERTVRRLQEAKERIEEVVI